MKPEKTEFSFKVSKTATLDVRNIRGPIQITRGKDKEITVSVLKHLDSGDAENTLVLVEQNEAGDVIVRTERDSDSNLINWGRHKACKVDYVITVPKNTSLTASNVSGEITIDQIDGDVKLNTVSGKIFATQLNGLISLNTVSGKIEGDQLNGEAKIDTVSGKSRLLNCNFSKLRLNTVSGKMVVETPIGAGPYRLNTVSGSIKLLVENDAAVSVRTHSISGRFKTSLKATSYSRSIGKSSTDINGGGTLVKMDSVSGNLYLLTDENDKAFTPMVKYFDEEQNDRPSSDERIKILNQLHQGELSIDDALVKLS